ncbi:DUF6886 family protein [Clostridium tunisiense]|uniref:DUF6886 family protein n=1 Tax=Clostridium tunisiense TaxID=219748 RepID=UPI0002D82C06|nr:DUF6886 family protein [Clostridium tunisiense]
MRLFHVSEENNIKIFQPRLPYRDDLDKSKGLVWAVNEECLPNFLTPRECPRVAYHWGSLSTSEDKDKYFTSKSCNHVVAIEYKWFEVMKNTTLYLYEFSPSKFYLQDETAGYYVSEAAEVPINQIIIDDIFAALFKRNVELRVVDNLWHLSSEIQKTSLNWSMCRMKNATPL